MFYNLGTWRPHTNGGKFAFRISYSIRDINVQGNKRFSPDPKQIATHFFFIFIEDEHYIIT